MKALAFVALAMFAAGCSRDLPRHAEPILSAEAASSFLQLVDYPKGEVAAIKTALLALDGRVALRNKTNVYIEFRDENMDVIFYPTPEGGKVGGDGTYLAKVTLNRDSLATQSTKIGNEN